MADNDPPRGLTRPHRPFTPAGRALQYNPPCFLSLLFLGLIPDQLYRGNSAILYRINSGYHSGTTVYRIGRTDNRTASPLKFPRFFSNYQCPVFFPLDGDACSVQRRNEKTVYRLAFRFSSLCSLRTALLVGSMCGPGNPVPTSKSTSCLWLWHDIGAHLRVLVFTRFFCQACLVVAHIQLRQTEVQLRDGTDQV